MHTLSIYTFSSGSLELETTLLHPVPECLLRYCSRLRKVIICLIEQYCLEIHQVILNVQCNTSRHTLVSISDTRQRYVSVRSHRLEVIAVQVQKSKRRQCCTLCRVIDVEPDVLLSTLEDVQRAAGRPKWSEKRSL